MISSTSNPKVRQVTGLAKKAKMRKELGLYVVEGLRMCRELLAGQVEAMYVSESFAGEKSHRELAERFSCELVSDEVLKAMSDTQTPQGILALVRQPSYRMEDLLKSGTPAHLMILETIQDPGNLGTIIRAGEGAGITGVIMNSGTADIYNPKVIRSTMGSIYRVPFLYTDDLAGTLALLKKKNIRLFAAHLKGKNNYEEEDYTGNTGFLIGNEASGLSDEISAMADTYVKIPMLGRVESLNAAVASSILMYEAARQRRNVSKDS